MTRRAALLTYYQAAPLRMKFMVVSYMVPRILESGLLHLVSDNVVNIVELVVHKLLFQYIFEI